MPAPSHGHSNAQQPAGLSLQHTVILHRSYLRYPNTSSAHGRRLVRTVGADDLVVHVHGHEVAVAAAVAGDLAEVAAGHAGLGAAAREVLVAGRVAVAIVAALLLLRAAAVGLRHGGCAVELGLA